MEEWTEEFVQTAQTELISMVEDWKYEFGADDSECSAMLMWMALRLKPGLASIADVTSKLCGESCAQELSSALQEERKYIQQP